MRGADGAGDRRFAAEPGRAPDCAGAGSGAGCGPGVPGGLARWARTLGGPGNQSDIYYLWSLERVCVALGLRSLDGFDWYAHGAQILVDRQESDGGWPHDRWGRLPSTALALLFLRKANLAFEIDRVLRLPGPSIEVAAVATRPRESPSRRTSRPTRLRRPRARRRPTRAVLRVPTT